MLCDPPRFGVPATSEMFPESKEKAELLLLSSIAELVMARGLVEVYKKHSTRVAPLELFSLILAKA
jgi:hypothetical protein